MHKTNKKLTSQYIRAPHLRWIGWMWGRGKQVKKLIINVGDAKLKISFKICNKLSCIGHN